MYTEDVYDLELPEFDPSKLFRQKVRDVFKEAKLADIEVPLAPRTEKRKADRAEKLKMLAMAQSKAIGALLKVSGD